MIRNGVLYRYYKRDPLLALNNMNGNVCPVKCESYMRLVKARYKRSPMINYLPYSIRLNFMAKRSSRGPEKIPNSDPIKGGTPTAFSNTVSDRYTDLLKGERCLICDNSHMITVKDGMTGENVRVPCPVCG